MQRYPAPATPALAVRSVTKTYSQWQRSGKLRDVWKNLTRPDKKEVKALDNLSLTVQPGEFVAYAGANGAGKSTTIKLLSGTLQPTSGEITVLGKSPIKNRVSLMREIGVLYGNRSELWWDYPVIASYEWKKQVWNIDDTTYNRMLATVVDMLDLKPLLQTFARELSLGQRMRADLGMLLLHNPKLIFLDEPTLGLDVLAKQQLIAFLRHINKAEGTTIVVTSHDMDDLQEMASRIVLLSRGKLAFDGSFAQLRQSRADKSTVRIRTADGQTAAIEGLEFAGEKDGELLYRFDPKIASIGEVLHRISRLPAILDVEIQKAPIEDVIASLYKSWG